MTTENNTKKSSTATQKKFEDKWRRRVLFEPALTPSEKVGAITYIDFIHRTPGPDYGRAWASIPTLLKRTNLSKNTLDSLFPKLRSLGYLEMVGRKNTAGKTVLVHRFILPEYLDWDFLDNLNNNSGIKPLGRDEKAARKSLASPQKTGGPDDVDPPQKTGAVDSAPTPKNGVPQKTGSPQKTGGTPPQKTGYNLQETQPRRETGLGRESKYRGNPTGEGEPDWLTAPVPVKRVTSPVAVSSRCESRGVARGGWDSSKTFRDFEGRLELQSDEPPF